MMPSEAVEPALDLDESGSLVEKSIRFLKGLTARLRDGASRRWRAGGLELDVRLLRRRRRNWILALGRAAYAQLRAGPVDGEQLGEYVEEIRKIEEQIAAAEALIHELERDELLEAADLSVYEEAVPRRRAARKAARRRDRGEVSERRALPREGDDVID